MLDTLSRWVGNLGVKPGVKIAVNCAGLLLTQLMGAGQHCVFPLLHDPTSTPHTHPPTPPRN